MEAVICHISDIFHCFTLPVILLVFRNGSVAWSRAARMHFENVTCKRGALFVSLLIFSVTSQERGLQRSARSATSGLWFGSVGFPKRGIIEHCFETTLVVIALPSQSGPFLLSDSNNTSHVIVLLTLGLQILTEYASMLRLL